MKTEKLGALGCQLLRRFPQKVENVNPSEKPVGTFSKTWIHMKTNKLGALASQLLLRCPHAFGLDHVAISSLNKAENLNPSVKHRHWKRP